MPGTWTNIVSTSTDGVISNKPTILRRVTINTLVASQTLKLYDVAAEADVAAANLIASIQTDLRGTYEYDVVCGRGLVAILSGGTVDITVVWG